MLSQAELLAVVLAPLAGALVAGLFGRQVGRAGAHRVTILGVAVSCALSVHVLYQLVWGGAEVFNENLYTWFEVGSISAHVGFLVDELTAMMMVVVTFVSLLVHVYTIGYMKDDPGYQRFFSYISLFTFAMLMLVMANNFLQLFFGWEAVGLVSYLLIGFWYRRPTAIFASLKAFLVNRVGDFGFLLGIGGVLLWLGSLDYATAFAAAPQVAGTTVQLWPGVEWSVMAIICICLFIGAMGKSAQVPLHVWLPDSMEGPTPISALIHAATMVTAGIFMVARMSPLFEFSATALLLVLVVGATTALFTGLIATVQYDIKRVVAYSTLSQLGYMTVALGVSAYAGAVFHLMTHAFFKALLFLAAGSVIIGMHHEQDMRRMGGLRRYMPVTYVAMLVGTLALVGFPFTSGYYSKDVIIEAVAGVSRQGPAQLYAYFAVVLGVLVTSFYSFRLLYLTFHGAARFHVADEDGGLAPGQAGADGDPHELDAGHHQAADGDGASMAAHAEGAGHRPHESPWVVTLPLVVLAVPSLVIGFLTAGPMLFGDFFARSIFVLPANDTISAVGERLFDSALSFGLHFPASLAFWMALAGFALATVLYVLKPGLAGRARLALSWPVRVLEQKYGFDVLWVDGFGRGGIGLGRTLSRWFDAGLIDGVIVNGSAAVIDRIAVIGRHLQSGYLYHYAFAMIVGLIALLGALLVLTG